jgi:hypothetical protein
MINVLETTPIALVTLITVIATQHLSKLQSKQPITRATLAYHHCYKEKDSTLQFALVCLLG